jgi:uncharacterized lipoprotein YehR (DUF1307 family)
MRNLKLFAAATLLAATSCTLKTETDNPMIGTWQLLTHTEITKGVSVVTDYTKDNKMIKIINATHFAFLNHTINTKKDSSNNFDAGGGAYTLAGDKYTEHLDYYKDKNWEGKSFDFTVSFAGDTLIQKGLEKVDKENINRIIIEKYLKVK